MNTFTLVQTNEFTGVSKNGFESAGGYPEKPTEQSKEKHINKLTMLGKINAWQGLNIPAWTRNLIDFVSAKFLASLGGNENVSSYNICIIKPEYWEERPVLILGVITNEIETFAGSENEQPDNDDKVFSAGGGLVVEMEDLNLAPKESLGSEGNPNQKSPIQKSLPKSSASNGVLLAIRDCKVHLLVLAVVDSSLSSSFNMSGNSRVIEMNEKASIDVILKISNKTCSIKKFVLNQK